MRRMSAADTPARLYFEIAHLVGGRADFTNAMGCTMELNESWRNIDYAEIAATITAPVLLRMLKWEDRVSAAAVRILTPEEYRAKYEIETVA